MQILVSLCNGTPEAPEALVLCDPDRNHVEPVPVDEPGSGVLGLCIVPPIIYCVFDLGRPVPDEPERSELRALDLRGFEARWGYPFQLGRDVHSLAAGERCLYAASTGTDEVLRLDFDERGRVASERAVWFADPRPERVDRQHLNAVAVLGGEILLAGFGPRPGPAAWRESRDGFVSRPFEGTQVLESIYHPHSICELTPGEYAVCESPRRRVVTSTGRSSETLPGYARGVCPVGDTLYVGTSRNRHPSEPRSILPHDEEVSGEGLAAVCELDAASLAVRRVIELDPHGREVYDIVALPG